ncbi:MAG TPA: type II toxin-antitoxin system RelE/ParE family toxin [Syntrophomonadaceae bacterium]|nr:type II toxin-antitoxin system RelE/ParE family toxin [Syntrophomonadaceae bacterium]
MIYEIVIPKSVVKGIKKLPKPVVQRIPDILREIAINPHMGVVLKGDLSAIRKWNIKEQGVQYRIAYTIHEERIEVRIILIGTRENFYKELKRRL